MNRQRLDVGTTCAFIVGPLIYHVTRAFEVFSSADPCALALAGADALRRPPPPSPSRASRWAAYLARSRCP